MQGIATQIPSRYPDEIALIEEYQWTWVDIQSAPAALIDELLTRVYATRRWRGERRKMDEAKQRADEARSKAKAKKR